MVASNKMKVALMILLMLYPIVFIPPVAGGTTSELTWSRTYAQIVGGDSLKATSDGGFVVTSTSFGAWVMRADASGQPKWEKTYTPTGYSDAESGLVQLTRDGGYLIAGGAIGLGGSHQWLLKLDNNGNVQWSRIYRGGAFLWIEQTSDGGDIA